MTIILGIAFVVIVIGFALYGLSMSEDDIEHGVTRGRWHDRDD